MSRVYMQPLRNWGLLAALVLRRPQEFRDRIAGYVDLGLDHLLGASPTYETVSWESVLGEVEARLGRVGSILDEPALNEIEEYSRRLLKDISGEDPFTLYWAADSLFARSCYLACRLLEPAVVVETGVAYGVSSAFVLKALEENGHGMLHSVDLPPLRGETERYWGIAVPEALRGRWELHRGSSRRVLPWLLEGLGEVDLFVHDSLHTYRNMRREFETAWPRLRTGGVILADDVERNGAFGDLLQRDPALWRIVADRERQPLHGKAAPITFGVAIK